METNDQKQLWDKIALEWYEFKKPFDKNVIDFVENSRGNFLDLGCGSGRYFFKTKSKIHGVDFSKEMINLAKKKSKELEINTNLKVSDISKEIPYEDNFFDSAICVATLHCIEGEENRKSVLKELLRVLKPKGKAMIKVWNKKAKRFKNKGKDSLIGWTDKGKRYYYFYDKDELKKDLESVGFNILSIDSKEGNFEKQEITVLIEKV